RRLTKAGRAASDAARPAPCLYRSIAPAQPLVAELRPEDQLVLPGGLVDLVLGYHVQAHQDLAQAEVMALLVEAKLLGKRELELLRRDVAFLDQILAEHLGRHPQLAALLLLDDQGPGQLARRDHALAQQQLAQAPIGGDGAAVVLQLKRLT